MMWPTYYAFVVRPPVATLDIAYKPKNREQRRRRMFGKGNIRKWLI